MALTEHLVMIHAPTNAPTHMRTPRHHTCYLQTTTITTITTNLTTHTGIIRAPGPEQGEPSPLEDPGSIDWQPFLVHLSSDAMACRGSAVYTRQQQKAADALLQARAKQDVGFLEWQEKEERAAHMQVGGR